MYRIELAPGEETVFRTIEELAVAVRNGLVTPRCRIYHSATQKWLPIEFHPHYKQALSLPAARIAEAVAPRTSGHPPRLETLSFAVAPAAKSTPAPEPVAEPAAETRAGDHPVHPPVQSRPQAERATQDHSPAKRPVGGPRVEQQPSGTEHAGAEHSPKKHSAAESAGGQYCGVEPSGGELSGGEHSDAEPLGHTATQHSPAQHPVAECVVPEQAAPKQPATDHPAREHAATTHSAGLHTTADEAEAQASLEHPVVAHPSAADSLAEPPGTQSPYPAHPAGERLPASRAAAEHGFASHADMAAAPSHAEPAPTRKSKSTYRPDSYLPPSVRVIPDDPYVATAPEPVTAPAANTEPLKAWPVMPAVQKAPELPTISYPEFTPAEEPVAERGRSSRGHRPLQVGLALLLLAAGGSLARSFYSPVRGAHGDSSSTPAGAVADRPALLEDPAVPAPSAVTTKPTASRPAVVTPTAPASSGFAAALEPRAIATGPAPIPARAAGRQPTASPTDSTTDSTSVAGPIAPAPAEMQMDVPALPGGDSLVAQPRAKSDSAMKRILRAVTGGKSAQ